MRKMVVGVVMLFLSMPASAGERVVRSVLASAFSIGVGVYAKTYSLRLDRKADAAIYHSDRRRFEKASRQYNQGANVWYCIAVTIPLLEWSTHRIDVAHSEEGNAIRYSKRF